jgi:hypothetical protein
MDDPVDIPYAIIEGMMGDLTSTVHGDGVTDSGERFFIQRFVSRKDGKVYDCVFTGHPPKCAEISAKPADSNGSLSSP